MPQLQKALEQRLASAASGLVASPTENGVNVSTCTMQQCAAERPPHWTTWQLKKLLIIGKKYLARLMFWEGQPTAGCQVKGPLLFYFCFYNGYFLFPIGLFISDFTKLIRLKIHLRWMLHKMVPTKTAECIFLALRITNAGYLKICGLLFLSLVIQHKGISVYPHNSDV